MLEQQVREQIQALEERRRQAMIERDMDFLEAIYSDDLTYSHSDGESDSKSSYLQGMRAGIWCYQHFDSHQERIRLVGGCAVMTGLIAMDVVIRDEPKLLSSRYISVWRESATGWQMMAWQSTRYARE